MNFQYKTKIFLAKNRQKILSPHEILRIRHWDGGLELALSLANLGLTEYVLLQQTKAKYLTLMILDVKYEKKSSEITQEKNPLKFENF